MERSNQLRYSCIFADYKSHMWGLMKSDRKSCAREFVAAKSKHQMSRVRRESNRCVARKIMQVVVQSVDAGTITVGLNPRKSKRRRARKRVTSPADQAIRRWRRVRGTPGYPRATTLTQGLHGVPGIQAHSTSWRKSQPDLSSGPPPCCTRTRSDLRSPVS